MNEQELFWLILCLCALLFFSLGIREVVLLRRFPKGHKERSVGIFTAIMLMIASVVIVWGGNMIDGSRRAFERLLPMYPMAHYVLGESDVFRGTSFVYKTTDAPTLVEGFYRAYAEHEHIQFLEDETNGTRMSFVLPSGTIFLTLERHDGMTVLYFTHEGEIRVVTR